MDEKDIKKTAVANSKVVLITIPFTSETEKGFVNVYKKNDAFLWTKVVANNMANNTKHCNFSNDKNELIMKFDLDNKFIVSKFVISSDDNVMQKSTDSQTFSTEGGGEGEIAPPDQGADPDCFKKGISYLDCLTCVLIKHCGNDLACVIAYTVVPEVCLGVSILACLPVLN